MRNNRIEPVLGDYKTALENAPSVESYIDGAENSVYYNCVCFDEAGNPLNQCYECPR